MIEIVQPRRFCGVLCISRSTCTYTIYSYRRETARQLRMYAQLTRCFSAVAELLVVHVMLIFDSSSMLSAGYVTESSCHCGHLNEFVFCGLLQRRRHYWKMDAKSIILYQNDSTSHYFKVCCSVA